MGLVCPAMSEPFLGSYMEFTERQPNVAIILLRLLEKEDKSVRL